MSATFENVRDTAARPGMQFDSTAGSLPTRTTIAETPENARAIVSVPIPTLKSLNSVGMLTTQMVFYRRSEFCDKKLAWESFPFEALDRRAHIELSGHFGYDNSYLRQVEFQPTQRIEVRTPTTAGGWLDAGGDQVADADLGLLAPLSGFVERPMPPNVDGRSFQADASVLEELMKGERPAQAQIKTLNHVLSLHRFFGTRGSTLKDEWKAGEVERLERVALAARLASHGHLYVRMFAKLLWSYYCAMYLEDYEANQSAGSVKAIVDVTCLNDRIFATPTIELCDADAPRFREVGVRMWSVAVATVANPPSVAYAYPAGVYVYRASPNVMYRYASVAACVADFGSWVAPGATMAALEVNGRVAELSIWTRSQRNGTEEHQPHEILGATMGGEVNLFERLDAVHHGRDLMMDVESVPIRVVELWCLANCSRNYRVASQDLAGDYWLPHGASVTWDCDYERLFLHSGSQRCDRLASIDRARLVALRGAAADISSASWREAIRWLLIKTGAEEDLGCADEIVTTRLMRYDSSASCGLEARAAPVTLDGLATGFEIRMPRDYSLAAYFYPFREQTVLSAVSENWLTLRPNFHLNMHYYTCIMLSAAFYWASYACSMQKDCWGTDTVGAGSVAVRARKRHGVDLLARRSEYAVCLHDKFIVNACAHLYGWAPRKATLEAIVPRRLAASSASDWTPVGFESRFREHVVPNAGYVYHELWLAKYIPDFLTLPCPEGTVKWPIDKPRPVQDSASDASQIRLGAALPALDYKYWLADGGQVMSAQYYLASNANSDSTDARGFKHGGAPNRVVMGSWRKPVQHLWPAAPGVVDPAPLFMAGEFGDYISPAGMRMYNHEAKLPMAWGVQRVNDAGVRVVGPVRSWYDITQGKVGVAPTLTYEAPLFGVREVDPVADYYVTALVDADDGKFVGYHWANVAKLGELRGDGPSRSISLMPSQPIVHPAALANDNSPHESNGWRSAGRARARDDMSRAINSANKSREASNWHRTVTDATRGVLRGSNRFSALREDETTDADPGSGGFEPILVKPFGPVTSENGVRRIKAHVVQSGGNKSKRSSLPQPKRTLNGQIVGGGAAPAGRVVPRVSEPSSTIQDALQPTTVNPMVMTARQSLRAAADMSGGSATAAIRGLGAQMRSMRRPGNRGLTRQRVKLAADTLCDLVNNEGIEKADCGELLAAFPEVAQELENRPLWRSALRSAPVDNATSGKLMFGDVEVSILAGGTDDSSGEELDLTDAATYETQGKIADAGAWLPPTIKESGGDTPRDAETDNSAAHLPSGN